MSRTHCIECGGKGTLTTLGGDWGKTQPGTVTCWACGGTGKREDEDLEAIKRNYPHRIEADPSVCPVCCGDCKTTDRRFGGEILYHIPETRSTVYDCLACDVWKGSR